MKTNKRIFVFEFGDNESIYGYLETILTTEKMQFVLDKYRKDNEEGYCFDDFVDYVRSVDKNARIIKINERFRF